MSVYVIERRITVHDCTITKVRKIMKDYDSVIPDFNGKII